MYASIVNNLEKSVKEADVNSFEDTLSISGKIKTNSANQLMRMVCVAPYRRKLAPDWKHSKDRYEEALKFNIILKEDETFVGSFIRSCRVSSKSQNEDSIRGIIFSQE